jgi:hypothetical protein
LKTNNSAKGTAEEFAIKNLGTNAKSVKELVGSLQSEGYSKDDSVKTVIALQRAGKASLREAKPYASIFSYAASPLSLWFWAAAFSVVLSMGLISVTSGAALYLRYAFGSVLVLFLPGYSLIEALYPKRELDELTRFALSIGLSLALVPLVGLVLNYTPFGIRLIPVTISIAGLTLVLLVYSLFRKHQYYKLAKGVA